MREITCDQFAAAVQEGLADMVRDWREGAVANPEDFPERMTFEAWRRHFCWTVLPDLEETAAHGHQANAEAA